MLKTIATFIAIPLSALILINLVSETPTPAPMGVSRSAEIKAGCAREFSDATLRKECEGEILARELLQQRRDAVNRAAR